MNITIPMVALVALAMSNGECGTGAVVRAAARPVVDGNLPAGNIVVEKSTATPFSCIRICGIPIRIECDERA